MYIATPLCINPITGRKVWAAREIPSGVYGDEWVSSFVIIRTHWFSKKAEIQLAEKIKTTRQRRMMQRVIREMDFKRAWALRDGRIQWYDLGASKNKRAGVK